MKPNQVAVEYNKTLKCHIIRLSQQQINVTGIEAGDMFDLLDSEDGWFAVPVLLEGQFTLPYPPPKVERTRDTVTVLTQLQSTKIATIAARFPNVQNFRITEEHVSGIGPNMYVEFVDDDLEIKIDITDVSNW